MKLLSPEDTTAILDYIVKVLQGYPASSNLFPDHVAEVLS